MSELVKDKITLTANAQVVGRNNSGNCGKIRKKSNGDKFKLIVRRIVQSVDNYNPYEEEMNELQRIIRN